jgi:predicted nucleic acid-binding protein
VSITLVDTSVLARLLERDSLKGRAAEKALRDPEADFAGLSISSQVLTEFWVVATRPAESNGYGLTPADADACLADFLDSFILLPDPPDLLDLWREIVVAQSIRGKQAHDAKLVAVMRAHGAGRVLTFNARDFRRYGDIEIVVPQ